MPDIRRLVTIDLAGNVEVVQNLEVGDTYQAVRDTFALKAPERATSMAGRGSRYAGTSAVSESHANGEVTWQALVRGNTPDQVLMNVETMLLPFERWDRRLHLEWRPDGANASTFWEVRGPAKWNLSYKWAQFTAVQSMVVDITVPTAPLARGATFTGTIPEIAAPAVVQLPDIGGTAPARMAVTLDKATGNAAAFGLLAWWPRLPTPPSGRYQPFGVLDAKNAALTGLTVTSNVGARTGQQAQAAIAGAGIGRAQWTLDMTGVAADDMADQTIDIEVWARLMLPSVAVAPRATVSVAQPGQFVGRFAREWGTLGRPLIQPTSGTVWRHTRLGTITVPLDTPEPRWVMEAAVSWAGGSGNIAIDYLVCVPVRSRACSPSGEPNSDGYPAFMPGVGVRTKRIGPDLDGQLSISGAPMGADSGIGGALLEPPPGDTDMLVWLADLVPDDPTANTESASASVAGVFTAVSISPRWYTVVADGTPAPVITRTWQDIKDLGTWQNIKDTFPTWARVAGV